MCVLTAKFAVSGMVLTNFRQEGGNFIPLPPLKPPQGELLGSGPGLGLVGLQASAYSFIWGETRAQVFSCKFCEMFENTFFIDQLRWLLLCLMLPSCVLFWGGRQSGCSVRCVCVPGIGGCSCILWVTFIYFTAFYLCFVHHGSFCLGRRPVRGFELCLCELCDAEFSGRCWYFLPK